MIKNIDQLKWLFKTPPTQAAITNAMNNILPQLNDMFTQSNNKAFLRSVFGMQDGQSQITSQNITYFVSNHWINITSLPQ
ncbi:MAG: hypothetical protein R3E32_13995 [Chitinophagales bacterium]